MKNTTENAAKLNNDAGCAADDGSGQITFGATHYGITTLGASTHLHAMLDAEDDWHELTGFDRACIGELVAWTRKHGLCPNAPDQPRGPSEDGVLDAGESPDDGPLPALRCGGWFGSS